MATRENHEPECTFPVIDEFGREIPMPRTIFNESHIIAVRLASGWIHRMNSRHIKHLPKDDPVTLVMVMDVLIDHTELYDPCLKQK
jgi:hypothetical protein